MYFGGCLHRMLLAARGGGEFCIQAGQNAFFLRPGGRGQCVLEAVQNTFWWRGEGTVRLRSLPKRTFRCGRKGEAVRLRELGAFSKPSKTCALLFCGRKGPGTGHGPAGMAPNMNFTPTPPFRVSQKCRAFWGASKVFHVEGKDPSRCFVPGCKNAMRQSGNLKGEQTQVEARHANKYATQEARRHLTRVLITLPGNPKPDTLNPKP